MLRLDTVYGDFEVGGEHDHAPAKYVCGKQTAEPAYGGFVERIEWFVKNPQG